MDKIVKDTIKELYSKNNFEYDEVKDLYSNYAAQLYHVPYEDCLEMKDGKANPEGKDRRRSVKELILETVVKKLTENKG